ncbi:MAG: hypothetical protein JNK15_17000 [Planctomycetes bacterium]|nr:hypothetical protein [Planctomycetota bacterium]
MDALLGVLMGVVGGGIATILLGLVVYWIVDPRGAEPAADDRKPRFSGRGMIGVGVFVLLISSYFFARAAAPAFWWEWLRSPRAVPVEPWQEWTLAVALLLVSLRIIMLGRRVRHAGPEP